MKNPVAFPTIAAIAEAAGVSAMTVSRALKGNTRHSPATRERIQRIAKEMGYRPNPLVSALMSARARSSAAGTTANLAVLTLGHAGRPVDQSGPPAPNEFLEGIFDQARNQGYAVEVFDLDQVQMSQAQLRRVFINRGIRGIILMPAPYAQFHLDFDLEGFAVSAIGFSVENDRLPRVSSDAYLRTLDGLRGLAKRGYRRIGIVNVEDMDRRFNFGMSAAAEIAARVFEPPVEVHRLMVDIFPTAPFDAGTCKSLAEWVRKHRLDAVLSQLDDTYSALKREGFRVGKDLAYLHLHKHPNKQVACMNQMFNMIGRKAVDMVGAMINRNEYTLPEQAVVVNIPSVWNDGLSVPDRSSKRSRNGAVNGA